MASVFGVERKDILSCDIVFGEFKPDAVRNILSYLTPDQARVDLLSPLFVRKLKDGEVDDTVWEDADDDEVEDDEEEDDEDCDSDDETYIPITHEELISLY